MRYYNPERRAWRGRSYKNGAFCGCTEPYVARAPGLHPSCPQCNAT